MNGAAPARCSVLLHAGQHGGRIQSRLPCLPWLLFGSLVVGFLSAGLARAAEIGPQAPEAEIRSAFAREVDQRLVVPGREQAAYAVRAAQALAAAGLTDLPPQFIVIVDRSPMVQAVFLYLRHGGAEWSFIGASPAATGRPGRYGYFLTPLGVFAHSVDNPDFRAEGTRNALGILGYGRKGMRIFDFGWVLAERGWGAGGTSPMRLQMHATDPGILEPRLGRARSKGCIRIPATLNAFVDRYGLIDADYEKAAAAGRRMWVLLPRRKATPWAGRYLIVVESEREQRPPWNALPSRK